MQHAWVQVAVEVEADPERAMGPTASTLAEAPDPEGQAFQPLHGFTVKDLRRDQRFRVRCSWHICHDIIRCLAKPAGSPALRTCKVKLC